MLDFKNYKLDQTKVQKEKKKNCLLAKKARKKKRVQGSKPSKKAHIAGSTI